NCRQERNAFQGPEVEAADLEDSGHVVGVEARSLEPAEAEGRGSAPLEDPQRIQRAIGFVDEDARRDRVEAVEPEEETESDAGGENHEMNRPSRLGRWDRGGGAEPADQSRSGERKCEAEEPDESEFRPVIVE